MGVRVREKPPGSGIYWIFINHNGKRKSKKIGDEKTANEVAEKIKAKLVLGELRVEKINNPSPTFKEYAELWLSLPQDFKENTGDEYRRKLKLHAFPNIGKLRLEAIDKRRLQSLFDGLAIKGLSQSTIGVIRVAVSEVLDHAANGDLIDRNPIRDLRLKKTNKSQTKFQPLTEKESALLLEESQDYLNGKYYPMMLTALRTGMRIGEMIALKWSDIDFEKRLIEVKRNYVKKRFSSPKNGKSRRVDITPVLSDVLKDHRINQKKWALKTGNPVPEFVFVTKKGKLELAENFRCGLEKCLEKAKLRRIRIHDLRHTYATIRLLRGHNIGDVSYQLGHSSIKITYDIYGHWIPGKFKSEVDELDQMHPNAPYTHPESNEV